MTSCRKDMVVFLIDRQSNAIITLSYDGLDDLKNLQQDLDNIGYIDYLYVHVCFITDYFCSILSGMTGYFGSDADKIIKVLQSHLKLGFYENFDMRSSNYQRFNIIFDEAKQMMP